MVKEADDGRDGADPAADADKTMIRVFVKLLQDTNYQSQFSHLLLLGGTASDARNALALVLFYFHGAYNGLAPK